MTIRGLGVVFTAVLAGPVCAHGGSYRGPGGVVPPPTGQSGTASSGTAAAGTKTAGSTPQTTPAARTGGPAVASSTPSASATGVSRGAPLEDDLTRWDFWWEFGKDPYLRLREAQASAGQDAADPLAGGPRHAHRDLQPATATDADTLVLPALKQALDAARDRDTTTGCLVALAKIGRDHATFKLHDMLTPWLRSKDQEVRETATLCIGIAGRSDDAPLNLLLAVADDTPAGRTACDRGEVDDRTRTFATYGLGLLLRRTDDAARRHKIVQALLEPLRNAGTASRNRKVAAIESLGLLDPGRGGAGGRNLAEVAASVLGDYFRRDLGPGEQLLQAHCPTVLARLVRDDSKTAAQWKDVFAGLLRADARTGQFVAQSCALALGLLATPWVDGTSPDAALGELLLQTWRTHRDQQTRSFALQALALQGGAAARKALLGELAGANKGLEKPWVALALGTLTARARSRSDAGGVEPPADREIAQALRQALDDAKNPSAIGGIAIALGLCRDASACDRLRELLHAHENQDDAAGYLCIALSLLDDAGARGSILDLLRRSVRRPQLLTQAATALGRLGDVSVVGELCAGLEDPTQA